MNPTPAPEPHLLNEGDEVACKHGSYGTLTLVKVERVTPTQAILPNGTKLRRQVDKPVSGVYYLDEIGRDRWSQWNYWLPTEQTRAEAELQALRKQVTAKLEKLAKKAGTADAAWLAKLNEALPEA